MMYHRPWILLLLAGCSWAHVSLAQTGGDTTGTGTTGTGGSGTGRTSTNTQGGAQGAPVTNPANPSDTTGAGGTGGTTPKKDPFGFGEPNSSGTGGTTPFGTGTGATTTFGTGPRTGMGPLAPAGPAETSEPLRPKQEPITYSAPGFYGSGGQSFNSGQSRFLRPRYRYGGSFGIGFDDNTMQTPNGGGGTPDLTLSQTVPEQPEIARTEFRQEQTGVRFIGGAFRPVYKTVQHKVVLRPFEPEHVLTQTVPGIPSQDRNASVVSSVNAHLDIQWAKQRSLFTFDLNVGGDYYWNRTGKPLEYTGSMSLVYLRKITPRLQFTALASLSYQSQPDYSQQNLNTSLGSTGGSYFNGTAKMDVSYRWGARFSTVSSITLNATSYESQASKVNDQWGATFGQEFRYIWSPHYTWVGELRTGLTEYTKAQGRNYNDVYLLLGTDWTWNRRLGGTLRLGEQLRKLDSSAGSGESAPYMEATASYQSGARSQFQITGRYGFEPTVIATDRNVGSRLGLTYARAFSPRLSGNVGVNYIHSTTTRALPPADVRSIYDSSLSLNYAFSRRLSVNARYNYTLTSSTTGTNDYDRSRLTFTGQYEF